MIPVESSSIELVGYDEETRELHVRFVGGQTYVYSPVTRAAFEALLEAPSKGRYVNWEIKPYHRYRRR